MIVTVGGRPVDLLTSLAFRWACWRAQFNAARVRRTAEEFAFGFVVGAALGVAGCAALVG